MTEFTRFYSEEGNRKYFNKITEEFEPALKARCEGEDIPLRIHEDPFNGKFYVLGNEGYRINHNGVKVDWEFLGVVS